VLVDFKGPVKYGYYNGKYGVYGIVWLRNGLTYDLKFQSVKVTLYPSTNTDPYTVSASCSKRFVPWSATPYTYGSLYCQFFYPYPSSFQPKAKDAKPQAHNAPVVAAYIPTDHNPSQPSYYVSAQAFLYLHGGATCYSGVTGIKSS
jgi:hypothetical protein